MTATASKPAPAPAPRRARRGLAAWWPWIAMAVVVVAALAIGTFSQPAPTATERAQHLAETIRCPSCKSQAVATSDTPASQAVRQLIHDRIKAGDTDDEIRDYVAAQYSRSILLDPSGTGFNALVWALPVAVAIVAVAALAFRFRDWRPGTLAVSDADRSLVAEALAGEPTADATPGDPPGERPS